MEKLNGLLVLFATIISSVACTTPNESLEGAGQGEASNTLELSLPATSRTVLGEKDGNIYPLYWSEEDCISVNGNASKSIEIDESDPRRAVFHFEDGKLKFPYNIVYPHSLVNSADNPKVLFLDQQEYVENSFAPQSAPMYGYTESRTAKITMKHLAGIIRFDMHAEAEGIGLSSITITSEDKIALAGEFAVNIETGELTPTANTSTKITYTLPEDYTLSTEKSNVFLISLPAISVGTCSVVFTTSNGNTMKMKWNSSQLKPGVVREFNPITFKQDATGILEPLVVVEDSFVQKYPTICGFVRDTDKKPIAGVAVSDGFSVVKTNELGYYELNVSDDAWHIFISVPSEYKIPVNAQGLPGFYKRYPGYSEWYNFTLEKLSGGAEKEFMLFGFADPQVSKMAHIERFSTQVAPEVKSYSASLGKPCYGITLGDVISMGSKDLSKDILPAMHDAMHADKMGMPVFQVMGNHDNCFMTAAHPVEGEDLRKINLNIQRMFEETFGPINYSFNRGNAHIIGMRNIQWQSGDDCATANTKTAFTKDQYNWLVQDLACVENKEDKLVILCVHIPLYNNGTIGDGSYRQEILNMLDEFGEAHILSGHLHYQHNYDHTLVSKSSHKIYEHAQAAVDGASWTSNINGDGVPNGYGVYHISGNTIKDWYYKGYAEGMNSRDYQIRLYRGNTITGAAISGTNSNGTKGYYQFGYGDDILLANVFNSDTAWTVEVYEDGKYSGKMTSLASYHWAITYDELIGNFVLEDPKRVPDGAECGRDFWAVGVLCGYLGMNNGGLYYKHCYQMWKYQLKNKNAKVEVRATDRKGNVYKCSTITDGRDMTYALYNK